MRIEVVATPGHTEGHVTYAFPDEGVIAIPKRREDDLGMIDLVEEAGEVAGLHRAASVPELSSATTTL